MMRSTESDGSKGGCWVLDFPVCSSCGLPLLSLVQLKSSSLLFLRRGGGGWHPGPGHFGGQLRRGTVGVH